LTRRGAPYRAPGHALRLRAALPRALLVVGIVLLGAAYFLPSAVRVTRSVVIARPRASVAALVGAHARFAEWSPWAGAATETPPAVAADGALSATLDLGGPAPVTSEWRLSEGRGITLVEWSLAVEVGADPLSRYRGILIAQRLGRDAARGLSRLQLVAERPTPAP
jgi:hypothetical protein